MCFAELDLTYLEEVRRNQPVFPHRRSDLYSLHFNEKFAIQGIFPKEKRENQLFFRFRRIPFWAFTNLPQSSFLSKCAFIRLC
jgi:hypothetical protein